MSVIPVIWPDGNLLDRIVAAIVTRVGRITGRSGEAPISIACEDFLAVDTRPAARVNIVLSRRDAFVQQFNGRSASAGDLRKIVANEANRLSPVLNEDMVLLARGAEDAPGQVDLVHVRTADMEAIETKARDLGLASVSVSPDDAPNLVFASPAVLSQTHRERRLWTFALLAMIAAMTLALAGLGHGLSVAASLAQAREAVLRADLLERREAEREIGALGALAALKPENRTSAARLEMLARLNKETPQAAWWTGIEISGSNIRLTGLTDNAASILTALTAAFPDQSVRFDETVSDTPDGKQKFVILITERNT